MKKMIISTLIILSSTLSFAAPFDNRIVINEKNRAEFKLGSLMRLSCFSMKANEMDTETLLKTCSVIRENTLSHFMKYGDGSLPNEQQLNAPPTSTYDMTLVMDSFDEKNREILACLLTTGKMNARFTHQGSMNLCEVSVLGNRGGSSGVLINRPLEP